MTPAGPRAAACDAVASRPPSPFILARIVDASNRWRGWLRAGLLGLALGLGLPAFGADPLPYALTLVPTGNAEIDGALADASQLATLRESAPVGPFALVSRAVLDAGRLDRVLRSFGYYDAQIGIRIDGRALDDPDLLPRLEERSALPPVPVEVRIAPGPLYRLGQVRLDGTVPADVRAAFDLKPGEPARARTVLAAGDAVLRALRADGFALARVAPPDAVVDHDTRTLDVVYTAEPGPRLAIGEIEIRGLDRLREDAVRRRLGLTPGEIYNPERLESARQDLLAGGALAWARLTPGTAPDSQGRLPLTLELAERPRRVMRFAGAYSSDEGATLSTSWTHRNLWGGGEQLTVKGELGQMLSNRPNELSYLAGVVLRVPDLWTRDLNLRLDLGAVNEYLEAYDREAVTAGFAFERSLSRQLAVSAGLAFEDSRVAQDGPYQDYRLLSLPLTLTYDGTDDPLNPDRGLRLSLQTSPARVLEGESSGFFLSRAIGSGYLDLADLLAALHGPPPAAGRTVLAGRLVLGSISGASPQEVPPDWRFYAGGGGSVRGYPYQSIGPRTAAGTPAGGDGLLEASLELRQRIGASWGTVAFVDSGAVSENGVPGTGALAVGVGLGVRYFTPIGPIRADIATPLNRQTGDSPVQLYIGIGQAF